MSSCIFQPSYKKDSPAMILRVVQSFLTACKKNGSFPYNNVDVLKSFCNKHNFDYEVVENYLTALNWGGKFEIEREFSQMLKEKKEG